MFPCSAGILPALSTSVAQALLPVRCSLRRNPPILAHARNRTQQSQEGGLDVKETPAALVRGLLTSIFSFQFLFCARFYVTLRYTNDPLRATIVRFNMTTKTTLSDEGMAQRESHSRSSRATKSPYAFAAPSFQGRWNTSPSPDAEFLIANLELEFELTYRKESQLKIPNRKYFAIFSQGSPPFSVFTLTRQNISNSYIRQFKNSTKPRSFTTCAISNRYKIALFGICSYPRFSPPKATSRDMIPALPPLQ
jgi:hypothetical protein